MGDTGCGARLGPAEDYTDYRQNHGVQQALPGGPTPGISRAWKSARQRTGGRHTHNVPDHPETARRLHAVLGDQA